jgi:aspartyl-tRNA(Asn)/glutamyl-tRNA(Gln) amidotransferase subunit B
MNKNEINITDIYLTPEMLKFILDKIKDGVISSKQAKEIFNKVLDEKKEPSKFITKENAQISDTNELGKIIDDIINSNPKQVEQYKGGKDRLFDFFVGQVMKNTRGKANPIVTKELLHKKLD